MKQATLALLSLHAHTRRKCSNPSFALFRDCWALLNKNSTEKHHKLMKNHKMTIVLGSWKCFEKKKAVFWGDDKSKNESSMQKVTWKPFFSLFQWKNEVGYTESSRWWAWRQRKGFFVHCQLILGTPWCRMLRMSSFSAGSRSDMANK